MVGSLTVDLQVTKAIEGQDAVISTLGPKLDGSKKTVERLIRDAHATIVKENLMFLVKMLLNVCSMQLRKKNGLVKCQSYLISR